MAVCGAGCMGFVNVARGLRAVGYLEPDPLPGGPVALVTHSGSVFSALLRARRGFGFSLAVSSGQELVTPAADYARYALAPAGDPGAGPGPGGHQGPAGLRAVLAAAGRGRAGRAAQRGPVRPGRRWCPRTPARWPPPTAPGRPWPRAYGVHRVRDLAELADTLELFTLGPRAPGPPGPPGPAGIATVHDSGLERAHVADLAADLGVPFAALGPATRARLAAVLDPGLEPVNPLDVWGTGRDTEALFTECLSALAADPAVGAVALAVDLVPEFDGDESYPRAVLAAAARHGQAGGGAGRAAAGRRPGRRRRAAGRGRAGAGRHPLRPAGSAPPPRRCRFRRAARPWSPRPPGTAPPAAARWRPAVAPRPGRRGALRSCSVTTASRWCARPRRHPRRRRWRPRPDRLSGRAQDRRAGHRA